LLSSYPFWFLIKTGSNCFTANPLSCPIMTFIVLLAATLTSSFGSANDWRTLSITLFKWGSNDFPRAILKVSYKLSPAILLIGLAVFFLKQISLTSFNRVSSLSVWAPSPLMMPEIAYAAPLVVFSFSF